jgi:hypothetical protein
MLFVIESRIMPVNTVVNQRKKLEHEILRSLGFFCVHRAWGGVAAVAVRARNESISGSASSRA